MENYKDYLKNKITKITKCLNGPIEREKIKADAVRKDYINSISSFPNYMTILSGALNIFSSLDKKFLILSFVCFLISSLIILYIKYASFKVCSDYILHLNCISGLMSDFSSEAVRCSYGEINEKDMMKKEDEFADKVKITKKNFKLGEIRGENILTVLSFYIVLAGSFFLVLSIYPCPTP